MDVSITTFSNPFSFFCIAENEGMAVSVIENCNGTAYNAHISRSDVSDFNHGQYVAVMWKDKWVRGIVTMESQFLIWLIDYGLYLRPNEKTVFINLPAEYKKYPTKVFEASIHGVVPVDKVLTDDCQIKNELTIAWNKGAVEKAQTLIASAIKRHFVPIAILSTIHNDVVLGDMYLQLPDKSVVNIVDELQMWPVFVEINPEVYIKNLPVNYTTRRKHRASLLKPEFPDIKDIPEMSLATSFAEYQTICAHAPQCDLAEFGSELEGGSSVVTKTNGDLDGADYKLTPAEIEKYSRMYVTVYDTEYNVLNILLNKLNDLRICQKYKDHDLKRIGRASSRHSTLKNHDDEYC